MVSYMDHPYFVIVVALILGSYLLDSIVEVLNLRSFRDEVPKEFTALYDPKRFATSQRYLRERVVHDLWERTVLTAALLAFMSLGGFHQLDLAVRGMGFGPTLSGLLFFGALGLLKGILQLPFAIRATFGIEGRYGFNKTTAKTFIADLLKGLLLSVVLGAPIAALILYFFEKTGTLAWLYAWVALTVFQLIIGFLAPAFLMPLFNRFKPLPAGELRQAIESYTQKQNFTLSEIYSMDASRRSTKGNAFFAGFGRFRRLVLFDTLIEKHPTDEAVSVVAHEVGHFKLGHIPKLLAMSILSTGVLLATLQFFLASPGLYEAFQIDTPSVYVGLTLVSFLYSPLLKLLSVGANRISRRFEYEADAFAARTFGKAEILASALKRLSVDQLSHLTPHRLKVWMDYSHPPVIERVRQLTK